LIVMLVIAVALLPLAKSGGRVNRWEGAALLATYIGYTGWLLTRAGGQ
jgi:cation:H+ antiporter